MTDTTETDRVLQRTRAATIAFAVAPKSTGQNAEARLPHILGTGFAIEDNPRVVVTAAHVASEMMAEVTRQTIRTNVPHDALLIWEDGIQDDGSGQVFVQYGMITPHQLQVRADKDIAIVTISAEAQVAPTAGLTLGSTWTCPAFTDG